MSFGKSRNPFLGVMYAEFANPCCRILPSTLVLVMMALEVVEWAR